MFVLALSALVFAPPALFADKRGYVAGKYGIELDGIMAGFVAEC